MDDAAFTRLAGYAGLAGALARFTGDMLLYGHLGAAQDFRAGALATVLAASPERLYSGGLLGPFGALLYLLGYWHVYRQVEGGSATLARLMYVAFCAFAIAAGVFHALTTQHELLLRACVDSPPPCASLQAEAREYEAWAYLAAEIPGYLASILLGYLVIAGRTRYPRWSVLANPGLLMLFDPFMTQLPAPLGAVVTGGYVNLATALFFGVSLLCTRARSAPR